MVYYFASRYSRHAELAGYRDELETAIPGAHVSSRWIDCHGGELHTSYPLETLNASPEACWRHGRADLDDIESADVVVSFTGPGGKGGRHLEHGYAMALGLRLVVIGPREHIFHCHPDTKIYESWPAFLSAERARAGAQ